jgi:hypothetical protein
MAHCWLPCEQILERRRQPWGVDRTHPPGGSSPALLLRALRHPYHRTNSRAELPGGQSRTGRLQAWRCERLANGRVVAAAAALMAAGGCACRRFDTMREIVVRHAKLVEMAQQGATWSIDPSAAFQQSITVRRSCLEPAQDLPGSCLDVAWKWCWLAPAWSQGPAWMDACMHPSLLHRLPGNSRGWEVQRGRLVAPALLCVCSHCRVAVSTLADQGARQRWRPTPAQASGDTAQCDNLCVQCITPPVHA